MKTFMRSFSLGVFLLFMGLNMAYAQEVTFSAGPSVFATGGGANGGFAWGDLNGNGNLDVFLPSNMVDLNNLTAFAQAASTMTANVPYNGNSTGLLLADFNGDGVPDLFTTNGGTPSGGLFYNTGGVFTPATGTGDLATAGVTGEVFQGASAAPIDHSNYLSLAWPGTFTGIASNNPASHGGGMWLLKGGPSGFTDIGRGAGVTSFDLNENFEEDPVGYAFPTIGWSAADIQSIDTLDLTGGTNKVLKNTVHNYNAAPVLKFVLPVGKTIADYNSFVFKSYWAQGDVGYKSITVEAFQTKPTGQAFNTPADTLGSYYRAQMGSTAWETTTINITNTKTYSDTVYIAFGINCAGTGNVGGTGVETIWYADSVTLVSATAPVFNVAIDTSLSYESWDVRFFDANNDGYQDLLMPSFRNGFSKIDTGSSGARKGCVLFLNDGTGKFYVPTSATLPGNPTIYSIGAGGVVSTTADTGIIVDDTVRHFAAIGEQWGDLNNDGIEDLILNGLNATDNLDGNGNYVADIILYGKGDGTYTYKWDGVHVVANNGLTQVTSQRSISIGDYNNDGLADIYTIQTYGPQHLYRNNGDGTFTDVATQDALLTSGARAGQLVDYNNDGFLDIFQYTGGSASLQKNNGGTNHWIGFIPIGTGHNMSAIGARFTVWAGGKEQIRDISASAGSAGMGGTLRANFGLGAKIKVDSVLVSWPDGTSHMYNFSAANNTLAVNKYYTIQEGSVIPSAPTNMRPSWASVDTSLTSTVALSWDAATTGTGTTTYTAQIASNASFSSIIKTFSALPTTSATARLGLSTKYYWRVQAIDNNLPGPFAIDSFHTETVVDTVTPKQLLPATNSTTVPNKPKLVVSFVPTASTYHFQVAVADSMFTIAKPTFVINDSTSDFDTTYAITTALTPSKTYYWRVRGYNPAGSSAFSPVDSFTIMFLPATPSVIHPSVNQANVPVNPLTLTWHHEAGDSNYVAQLWTYTTGGQVLLVDTTKRDTSWTISSGLLNRAYYYWKVQCYNQGGASAYSPVDSFTSVIEVASAPQAVSPKGTAVAQPMRTTFAWDPAVNAVWYHLQIASASDFSGDIVVDTTMLPDTAMQIADTLVAKTTYYYRLSSINLGGEGAFSGATVFKTGTGVLGVEGLLGVPDEFALFQNYPNPFNPSTTIRYDLPKNAYVQVIIYDVLGRQVAKLVDGMEQASHQQLQWNPSRLSSGIYFCRITARSVDGSGNFTSVKKLVYMK